MKITFDTNVWQQIVSPEKYFGDPLYNDYKKINEEIKRKRIVPFISATVFTLEAINKKDRLAFLQKDKNKIQFNPIETHDSSVKMNIVIGSKPGIHPGNNNFVKEYLDAALILGFNILRLSRIGGISNPQMDNVQYYQMSDSETKITQEVVEKIEKRQAGTFHAMKIGNKYDSHSWYRGLGKAPETESKRIAKALAEWSDGDSVGVHIGIEGDYFCTNDRARGAGSKSVFSKENLRWLEEEYKFKCISPEELADFLLHS